MRIIKNTGILIGLFWILSTGLISSCSEEGTNPADEKFILPDSNISFYEHIEPLFNARCGLESGCHSSTDTDNPLMYNVLVNHNLLINYQLSSTGEQLVDLTVHEENPHLAPLYLIVSEGYPSTYDDLMPPQPEKEPLTVNQIEGIRKWIGEGAQP